MTHKICTKCGEDKPLTEYRHKRWNAQGESVKRAHCNSCDNKDKQERRKKRKKDNPVTHLINTAIYTHQTEAAAAQGSRIPGSNLLDALASYLDARADLPRSYGYDSHEKKAFRNAAQRLRQFASGLEYDQQTNPDVETKVCPGCDTDKPLDEFVVLETYRNGIISKTSKYCESCEAERKEQRRINFTHSQEAKNQLKGKLAYNIQNNDPVHDSPAPAKKERPEVISMWEAYVTDKREQGQFLDDEALKHYGPDKPKPAETEAEKKRERVRERARQRREEQRRKKRDYGLK